MKLAIAVAGLLLTGNTLAAPFCVVDATGQRCWYYNADDCQRQARMSGGMCVAQATTGGAQQAERPSLYDSFSRGRAEGEARRQREEEHRARMALLAAQAEAAKAPAQPPVPSYVRVRYACPDGSGNTYESYAAAIGCVVLEVVPIQ